LFITPVSRKYSPSHLGILFLKQRRRYFHLPGSPRLVSHVLPPIKSIQQNYLRATHQFRQSEDGHGESRAA
jgi:hypothetical protein